MTPEQIAQVAKKYENIFVNLGVSVQRISTNLTFGQCSVEERLAHGHFLVKHIPEYAINPSKIGKANRHLGFTQAIFSYERLSRLDDLMGHNHSKDRDSVLIGSEEVDQDGEEPAVWRFHGFYPLRQIQAGKRACRRGWRSRGEDHDMCAAVLAEDSFGQYVVLERERANEIDAVGEGRINIEDQLAEDWYVEVV